MVLMVAPFLPDVIHKTASFALIYYQTVYPDFLDQIISILNYIDTAAPLLTLFFFIKPFKKLAKELRFIFWFVAVQFITNLVSSLCEMLYIWSNHSIVWSNYSIYALNIVLSFGVLSYLFYQLNIPVIKKLAPVFSILFTICAVFSLAKGDGVSSYNSILSALASFVITAYCLIFFYWRLVKDTRLTGLTNSSFFWIVIGLFTYYTGSFFIFISYNYLIAKEFNAIGILWRFHNVLLTIFCIYTIYGLTCKNYQKT